MKRILLAGALALAAGGRASLLIFLRDHLHHAHRPPTFRHQYRFSLGVASISA